MKKLTLIYIALLFLLAGCTLQQTQQPQQEQLQTTQSEQSEQTQQSEQSEQTQQSEQSEQAQQSQQSAQAQLSQKQLPLQEGGTLHLSMRNTTTLNPLLNQDASVDTILKLIYMPLIKLDKNYKPSASIAQSWSFDEGGTVLSLNLRNDIYWQNGTNLTADDVIYSLDTLFRVADSNAVYKNCTNYIRSYRKISNYDIEITFHQNFSGNLYALLFPIISSQYYGSNIANSDKNMLPMGNGYFEFVHYTPAKEMRLKKCISSFGTTAHIDEISVNISTDKDTDLYSFEQGLTDILVMGSSDIGKSDNDNEMKYYQYTTNYYDFIGFNFSKSLFQDSNVRKAIASITPKQAMLESIYLGHGITAQTPINTNYWFYEPDTVTYDFDIGQARDYLEASNWKDTNDDGILDRTTNELSETFRISILYNTENEIRKQVAIRIADELRGIGAEVSLDGQSYDNYIQKLQSGDFDLFVGGWQFSVVPNYSFLLHSAQASLTNYPRYQNGDMDALLASAYSSVKDEDIKMAYSNLQKKIAEELPYISIVFRDFVMLSSDRVQGQVKPLENNIFDNINEWYLYEQ
ncbi:ABC transporter substrate-binding protein [Clostridium sp. MD294]|nr:ABC transporter substrate-binding protein [Clostridium sp. MD294]NDO46234.1 hypothetical protein [Clostridium sp. MD294]USF30097.1 Oligopeptide-binding protein AppA [Clostridium sp. MD294]